LDQLAPENPVLKEILAIRDDISSLSTQVTRRAAAEAGAADLVALRAFIEDLVETNVVGTDKLGAMETPETTPKHDEWVKQIVKRYEVAIAERRRRERQRKQTTDDPWASAPPAASQQGDYSDEPPF
jgi:hypothetical protein